MTDESHTRADTDPAVESETPAASIPADSALPQWLAGLPDWARPYVALSRFDRPVGIWLLALPCWIGLAFTAITAGFSFSVILWAVLFFLGAIPMRGAGCTWNDITDRNIDAKVARTAARPLPSGQVTLTQAVVWLVAQLAAGFIVWLFLPIDAKIIALLAIPLVVAYPFMKRITWWPQAWLGIVFNWGVFIAAATLQHVSLSTVVLWLGLACWTIAYDTIYATQDIEDDSLIGVRSTARLFGDKAPLGAFAFHIAASAIIALAAISVGAEQIGAITVLAFLGHGIWQTLQLRDRRGATALAMFKANVWAGAILVAGFTLAALF